MVVVVRRVTGLAGLLAIAGLVSACGTSIELSDGETVSISGEMQSSVNNADLEKAKADAVSVMDGLFDEIEDISEFESFDSTFVDELCDTGRNGPKRTEPYVERCEVVSSKYFGFNSDFESTVLELADGLDNDGWSDPHRSLADWLDSFYKAQKPESEAEGRSVFDSLPSTTGFERDGYELEIDFADGGLTDFDVEWFTNQVFLSFGYHEDVSTDGREVPFRELIEDNQFVMRVTISNFYYTKDRKTLFLF